MPIIVGRTMSDNEKIAEPIESKNKKALKSGIAYTICNFILKGMAFFTMPIFTRIMLKSEIGQFSTMASWISILSVVVTLGLSNAVPLAKYDFKDSFKGFLSSITILSIIPAIVFGIIIFLLRDYVSTAVGLPNYAIYLVLLYLVFCSSFEILQCQLRVEYKYKTFVAITLLSSIITIVSSLVLVYTLDDGLLGRALGNYVPLIIIGFVVAIVLIVKGKSFKLEHCKYALIISLPLVIHNLAGTIMHSSDRIMIQALCDADAVALYSVAYSGALLVNLMRNSMESAWDPWVFDMIKEEKQNVIKIYSYPYIIFFIIISIGVILVAPEFLYIMGGDGYVEAMYVIPPVVLAYVCSMFYSLYGALERYYKKQIVFPIFGSICAAANIGLNFLFIPKYGYIAAAYTTFFSCFLEMILHYFYCYKINKANYYDTKFNLICLILCSLLSFLAIFLYKYSLIRYLFIGALVLSILIVLWIKRKWLIDYLKTIRGIKKLNEEVNEDENN